MALLSLLTLGLVAVTSVIAAPETKTLDYLNQKSIEVDSSEHGGEAGAKSTTCTCGWANKVSSRVVGGTETASNEFPFVAAVVYRGSRSRFCGATIISRYHALTAAHCTIGKIPKEVAIVVGIHNINSDFGSPADEVPIEKILENGEYDNNTLLHDIAMLVMEREIKFSQLVGPACLPLAGARLNIERDREYVKIIGWGALVDEGAQSPVLRNADVRVVPMNECSQVYSIINPTVQTQICTYSKMKGICQGDSGGPVVWLDPETNRYTLVGIPSFASICGDKYPSVHTSVESYLVWIDHYIKATGKPNAQTCTKSI